MTKPLSFLGALKKSFCLRILIKAFNKDLSSIKGVVIFSITASTLLEANIALAKAIKIM